MNSGVNKLQQLFAQIASRPKGEWQDLLERLTKDEPELRVPLEALLNASQEPDSLLDPASLHAMAGSKSGSDDPGLTTYDMRVLQPDLSIGGRYRLVERIGEGGMGEVWLARQSEPVKRSVAIKLIKSGMDSKSVLARFEAERQALAMMDHPNIAKVLDGGLMPDGQPFFVMELVKGTPITEFCDRLKLSPEKRLELFIPVCNAIQHAHQKGIIHRDIKPSNVLVALFDDVPVTKVIDFGVAKATGGGLTEQSVYTFFGGIVGTPQYMSPEQATLNNLDIDTRSDVYSLGVLLYELLAGAPPFSQIELEKAGVLEILRVVREVEPPRPSAKLSSSQLVATLSANRSSEPQRLTRLLRSELDWIVLKALEKERSKRYESAQGFAADILRYLAGEQVIAHPPTLMYRLRKVAHRNRSGLIALSAVLLAMLAGLAGTSWQMLRANREASRALTLADNARKAKEEAEDVLISGMMRPLGFGDLEEGSVARTTIEDIAQLESSELKLKILDRAIRTPQVADRLPTQMAWILQGCVGLDATSHQQATENALAIFRDQSLDHRVRYAALSCLNELDTIGTLSIDEFANYVRQAPDERKEGVWESLVWVNLRDNPDGLVDFLFECLRGNQGQNALEFACADLENLASEDSIFAGKVLERLDRPQNLDVWLKSDDANIQLPGTEIIFGLNPAKAIVSNPFSLRVKTIACAFPNDPTKKMRAYCNLAKLAESNHEKTRGGLLLTLPDFWTSLADADDEMFTLGVELALRYLPIRMANDGNDFLYTNRDSLYKISNRLSPSQAAMAFEYLSKDLGLLYSYTMSSRGDAVIGVALNQVGSRLSADDASRFFRKLSDQLSIDRRYGTIANSLQAIAGVAQVPGFPEPGMAIKRMLEYLPKVNVNYVRNACWSTIVRLADQIDPTVIQEVTALIQADLEAQLSFGEFDKPEILVEHLMSLSQLGTEVDLESFYFLFIVDCVKSSANSDGEITLALKMLEQLTPASRRNVALASYRTAEESTWNMQLLFGSSLEKNLLLDLSFDDQKSLADRILEFLESSEEPSGMAVSTGWNMGEPLAILIQDWPDSPRIQIIEKAFGKLREQLGLQSGDSNRNTKLVEGAFRFLVDARKWLSDAQQQELSLLLSRHRQNSMSCLSEDMTKLIGTLNADPLKQFWQARVSEWAKKQDKSASDSIDPMPFVRELALIGSARFQKDRDGFIKDFSLLMERVDEDGFAKLAIESPLFGITMTKQEYQSIITRAANRLLSQGSMQVEIIAFADDVSNLSNQLTKIECVGDLRAALLNRLEQIAFQEEVDTDSSPDAENAPNANILEWSYLPMEVPPKRKHFRSLRDFMVWNLSRPPEKRWFKVSSETAN